ncbi:hypothetical protein AB0E10_37245 [Streptomyces sp. NPDC048045]|uniref:hypothetical protein n=1 Tax=Streptomyces sp. NPDC048045 TaxID=3154710 RepID=UPI0034411A46
MPEMNDSVLQVLMASMGALPTFNIVYLSPGGKVKDRVLKHDLLHVLLIDREWPVTFRFEDEYSAAVVQAVLMRDSRVSARSVSGRTSACSRPVPGLDEIREVTIPGVVSFLRNVLSRFGLRVPHDFRPPDIEFIQEHYRLGLLFAEEFRAMHGEDYAAIPAETLKDIPFTHVFRSFQRAVARL